MQPTYETVVSLISETSGVPRESIAPDSHIINDLKVDSLDFLDVAFGIDKAFGIKLPLETWTQEVNSGRATTDEYFILSKLCARIDGLRAG